MRFVPVYICSLIVGLCELSGAALFLESFNYEDGELQAASSSTWAPTDTDDSNPNLQVTGGALQWDFTGAPTIQ